ncbi:MAG: hypothetical protein ACON31_03120, partial [Candidatus Puniceispirillaceae bacterium]
MMQIQSRIRQEKRRNALFRSGPGRAGKIIAKRPNNLLIKLKAALRLPDQPSRHLVDFGYFRFWEDIMKKALAALATAAALFAT